MPTVEEIKKAIRKKARVWVPKKFLSTGSTTLNLACSGRIDGGFAVGTYNLFVGDSDSGKTFLGLTCLAEATIDPYFDEYDLIYDAPEGGALMDLERFFGRRLVERIRPPAMNGKEQVHSRTVEEFYYHLDDAKKRGKPFVYVLDSQDCLSSKAEIDKFVKTKRTARKQDADKAAGSYGDNKAKVHSANLRRVCGDLQSLHSILVILNQTRDSFSMFEHGTFSGGRALKFYAKVQLWSSVAGKLERTVRGKKRQLGIYSKVKVKKNHITGKERVVIVPIYHSCGIDDVGGMIDYLVDEKVWPERDGVIKVTGMGPEFSMKREKLIQKILDEDLWQDLREIVGEAWREIEKQCEVKRARRYD